MASTHHSPNTPLKVLVLGGGNWGTAISRIIALNAQRVERLFFQVYIWIRQESYGGTSLSEYLNTHHMNPKYLPNVTLPDNLIAVSSIFPLIESVDLLVFVVPHQFLEEVVTQVKGHVSPKAKAISLVKGLGVRHGDPFLFSDYISQQLHIPCSVLSGANVANDIAEDQFCETTIGYPQDHVQDAFIWQLVFDYPTFKVTSLPDPKGCQVCGALKNVVALAAGFCDGLQLGTNTKAAIIHRGVQEMLFFAHHFFPPVYFDTFLESAGYPDIITTCFGGRNVRCAQEFVRRKGASSWAALEAEMLNGQKLQGHLTCLDIYTIIRHHGLHEKMPLFLTVYQIAFEHLDPNELIQRFAVHHRRDIKTKEQCVNVLFHDQ